jgi:hypothetical protein
LAAGRRRLTAIIFVVPLMRTPLKREMTITHEEFMRIFKLNFPEAIIKQGPDFIILSVEGGEARIRLLPEKRKKIATLEWVVTDVELDLSGVKRGAAERFLVRFERAYYKGGG